MHPVFRSKAGFRFYLCPWMPLWLIITLTVRVAGRLTWAQAASVTVPVTFLMACVCLAPWYACRSLPLRTTPRWKVFTYQLVGTMWATTLVMVCAHILANVLDPVFPGLARGFGSAAPVLAGILDMIYLLAIALYYVVLAIESSRQAELLSREAELKAIKAQVNPHFLFNSLNSISALTTLDPAKAREMCVRLSDFLRASLRLGERSSIPFSEELALTRSYLDVEQVRFGQRLRVRQDFDPVCSDYEVPPLLVQPLVENAIKHGIATLTDGGEIALTGQRDRDSIRIVIENPFDPDAPVARRNGFGLASVRNRLHARYGAAARLDMKAEGNIFRVVLSLPFTEQSRDVSQPARDGFQPSRDREGAAS
jgi:two-component system, LytTR family, sensor histidine kinase AlgZ